MLDKPDTEIVREWLIAALEKGKAHGKTAAGLATLCQVKPQAVNGWKTTGRITKSNLEKAARYFGHAPKFLGAQHEANEPYGSAEWPFKTFGRAQIKDLKPKQLDNLEAMIRLRLSEWAEEDGPAIPAKRRRA